MPVELESLPRSTESHKWQRVSSDVWEKIILAAFTDTGAGRGGALDAAVRNDRGCPIGVVVVWDPNPFAFVEACLNIKGAEARSLEGQVPAWDIRAVVVPANSDREAQSKPTSRMPARGLG